MSRRRYEPDRLSEEERRRAARNCFACGADNPWGLKMRFEVGEGVASAEFRPEPHHQGYPGLLHGGLVATLLDEAMGWAAYSDGAWSMTARMSLRFRAPVPLDALLRVEGRVTEVRRRFLRARAEIRSDGALLAEGEGTFARLVGDSAERLERSYGDDPS